jgi:hypothetical protein
MSGSRNIDVYRGLILQEMNDELQEHVMSAAAAQEMIARELQQAVERLHRDIERVEFWADALGNFSKPIPDYEASGSRLNEFVLPARTGNAARVAGGRELKK